MAYISKTIVTGTLAGAPVKPDIMTDYAGFDAWQKVNWKCWQLKGHWDIEKVAALAERHGVFIEKVEMVTDDTSGKGRGGLDRRFFNINGHLQAIQC